MRRHLYNCHSSNRLLTATSGTVVMHHNFYQYEFLRGAIPGRAVGVLIASEPGQVTAYALDQLKDRGDFFVEPTEQVYEGQIVGEVPRAEATQEKVLRLMAGVA